MQQMGWFPASQILAAMPRLGTGHSFPTAQGGQLTTATMQQKTATAQTDATKYVYERVFDKLGVQRPGLVNSTTPNLDTPGHSSPAANPILTYYFHPDHLGSSSYVSGNGGRILQHMEYLPFGEAMMDEHINSRNNPFKYNGKHLDEETGNYYYGARYYDPKLSNFISVDPLAEDFPGMSSYAYTFNNPINLTDPTGMAPEDDYTIDKKTGEIKWLRKTEDKTDRIVEIGRKGKEKELVGGIAKGILKDGINFKKNYNVIDVGGKDQPTEQDVKDFLVAYSDSNQVGVEVSGYGLGNDRNSDDVNAMLVEPHEKNKLASSESISYEKNGVPAGLIVGDYDKKKPRLFTKYHYHTHPKYGTDINNPSKDDSRIARDKNIDHFIFNKNGEFKYENYKPNKK